MEEENKKRLIEKIIREQDLVALYTYNNFNKSLSIMQEYSDGIYYSNLYKFILENPEIMDSFSIKNLYTLIASANSEEKEIINERLAKRLEHEDFFCEDIDSSVFMKPIHTSNAYGRIDENLRKKFGDRIVEELKKVKKTECAKIAENIGFYTDAANFLKYYRDGIFTPEKIEVINKMIDKNPNALRYMNFGLFQDEVFEMGADFCEYMAKFPTISYQLLLIKENAPQMFKAISDRVKTYDNFKDNLNELEVLITYGARNLFELQNEEIEIDEFLECAYRSSNEFELINVNYGRDNQKRLQEKLQTEYDKAITVEQKLNVYMNKVYSLSLKGAKNLLKDFASDLENLENLSEETKQFFCELEKVVELNDKEQIDRLFSTDGTRYSATQIQKMKSEIQKECAREFAVEFRNTDQRIKQQLQENQEVTQIEYDNKKIKQVKLNGKFNILFHSTDAEFINTKDKTEDFKEDWNNGKNKNNHIISTAYVNQDFLGMAPVGTNGVRYAFSTVQNENIRLMGVTDLNTYSTNFAYDSASKQYMSANTLVYNSRRVYSEFGIEREGAIPDYVVVMDDDLPEVIENSYKAAAQWDIPIIYIDKSEIEQQQIENLENLLNEFKNTNDTNILQKLLNTYETNVAGWLLNRSEGLEKDGSHTAGIDNTRFEEDFKNIQTKIEDAIKQFLALQNENTQSEEEISTVIRIILNEIDLYEGCEENKPISKTKISLNAKELLQDANEALDAIGKTELKVDLDKLPSSKEYKLKIQQLVKNALGGENAVTVEDIYDTKKLLEKAKEENTKENRSDEDGK